MQSFPQATALLIIDVQDGLDDPKYGERNNPQAEENIGQLLAAWRRSGRLVIHIQHNSVEPDSPLRPELPGNAIKAGLGPEGDEPLFGKTVNSAFIGTNLEAYLRERGLDTLVVAGLTTNHCVSTTARMAGDLGFDTYVVSDATAAHELTGHDGQRHAAEAIHTVALASLHEEFATVIETENVLSGIEA